MVETKPPDKADVIGVNVSFDERSLLDPEQCHQKPYVTSSDGGSSHAQPAIPSATPLTRRVSMPPSIITSSSSGHTLAYLEHGVSPLGPVGSPRDPPYTVPSLKGSSHLISTPFHHQRQPSAEAPTILRSTSAEHDSLSSIRAIREPSSSEATSTLLTSQPLVKTSDPTPSASHADQLPPRPLHGHVLPSAVSVPFTRLSTIGVPTGSGNHAPGAPSPELMQTFQDYLSSEARAQEKLPTTDVVWGQTERERVYNFLIFVPYQLERLIEYSFMLCFDCVLGVVTMLPLRCCLAIRTITASRKAKGQNKNGNDPPTEGMHLSGGQLFDLLSLLILVSATVSLRSIPPGFIYYWLKDIIVNEFLKMSVLSAALEISERIVGNFGLDVMEALSGTCTLWVMGRVRGLRHLICDTLVAFVVVLLHAIILMCEALVLAMALNSVKNGLLGLLIASNFVEIKGNVFKRWDVERIRKLVWMDVVERFQLLCILGFVVIEDMDSGSTWMPSLFILGESLKILGAEIVIDITKHAVLGKFTDVRPGIYKEYMKDLCDKVTASQSHNLHKLLGFHHMACCTLLLRSALTLFWLKLEPSTWQVFLRALLVLGIWIALLLFKLPFGYALKWAAHRYAESYNNAHHGKVHPRSTASAVPPSGTTSRGLGASRRDTPRGEGPALTDVFHPSRQKQE